VAAVAPAGPSAAELAARRRAAAARRRAARLEAQRRQAARVAAQKRAAKQRRTVGTQHTGGISEPESALMSAVPVLALGLFCAAICFAAAMIPARALPWERASRALVDRREDLALLGGSGLGATALLFLFVLVTS